MKLGAWIASSKIDELVRTAQDIYTTDAMSFPDGIVGTVASEYLNGVAAGAYGLKTALAKGAHDFVIPSASQLLIPGGSPAHLGNMVNPTASHLTGAERWETDDGETDESLVVDLLNRLKPDAGVDAAEANEHRDIG